MTQPIPPPTVSLIVPCRNEADHIEGFLRDVLAQEPVPGGAGVEVLIADGMSDDGTRAVLAAIAARNPRVRLIDNPGRITSAGLNAAIRGARGEIVIRMDVHTAYAPDYVRECVAVLRETGADNVGGPWLARGDGPTSRAIAAAFQSPFAAGMASGHDPLYEGPLDTVYLGCWRREAFDRFGLFDEDLVRNQDDEFNLRIHLAGGRVWQSPRIRSWYCPRPSIRALFRQYVQYGYWKVRVIRKHGRPASARHLVPVLFVLGLALGWTPGFLYHPLWWAYAAALAAYGFASLTFSLQAAAEAGWRVAPALPLGFLAFHVGYGAGFTMGLWDFVLHHRSGRSTMATLTRPPHLPGPKPIR